MVPNFRIVNVVATADLDRVIDLDYLPHLFPRIVMYEPSAYQPPAPAYFKSEDMQGKVSIFPSGKMISVGTKSEEKARQELILVADRLKKAKVAELKTDTKIRIENIVAASDIGFKPDLKKISAEGANVVYEPEQFPGAIIRLTIPKKAIKSTILLFASGKMVCVGLKNSKDVQKSIQQLFREVGKWQRNRKDNR